jgi:hypothetical protein
VVRSLKVMPSLSEALYLKWPRQPSPKTIQLIESPLTKLLLIYSNLLFSQKFVDSEVEATRRYGTALKISEHSLNCGELLKSQAAVPLKVSTLAGIMLN